MQARPLGLGGASVQTRLTRKQALLETAVRLDPEFAQAWALLAQTHVFLAFSDVDHTPARFEKAKEAIATALRIAPDDPEVLRLHGFYHYARRDYPRAAEIFQRVASREPNNAGVHDYLANLHPPPRRLPGSERGPSSGG